MFSDTTLQDLVNWTNARANGDLGVGVKRISTDTRTIRAGDVFVALEGDNFDGHEYIERAVEAGAIGVISQKAIELSVPIILVQDSLMAMVSIAKAMRDKFAGPVVGITGSAGKSTTKNMVATLLGEGTVFPPSSFNNLNGVSQTIFRLEDSTQQLVLELGMNALGEIKELAETFRPTHAMITNIGDAHMGNVGGPDGVYTAKKELFEAGSKSEEFSVALNLDDPAVVRAFEETCNELKTHVVPYSATGNADAWVAIENQAVNAKTGFLSLSIRIGNRIVEKELAIFGEHNAQNIAAAIAVSSLVGVTVKEIEARLDEIQPADHRGEIHNLDKGITLIDESYNSNPQALLSSLGTLSLIGNDRRHFIVVGDMLELGKYSEEKHRECGEALSALYQDKSISFEVLGVGNQVKYFIEGVERHSPKAVCHLINDVESAKPKFRDLIKPQDVVFVKSSRGGKLDELVSLIHA